MVDLEQEEMIRRVTAQYVAELQSGHQPQLRQYLARYPQYASEIADFIAYYREFEMYPQDEADLVYVPSSRSGHNVLVRSLQQLYVSSEPRDLFLSTGSGAVTLSLLAQELDLSEDILLLLERRLLLEETLPAPLVEKLAFVLHQPERVVRSYLKRPPIGEKYQERAPLRFVAEETSVYEQDSSSLRPRSFVQALEESTLATAEQKQRWHQILTRDQREKNAKDSLS